MCEYLFDDFRANEGAQTISRDGRPVKLAPRLLQILFLLLERHPNMVSREELRDALWPDSVVEEGALAQNIYLLRKALGDCPDGGQYIQTIPKQGYRFLGEVRRLEPDRHPEAAAPTRFWWSDWRAVVAVVAVVLLGGLLASTARPGTAPHQPGPEARRLYAQGRAILKQRRLSGRDPETLLRRAIELDPDYADAYAALAEMLATQPPPAQKAQELIGHALTRFPNSAYLHAVAGFVAMVHRWDWRQAEGHFRRAIEINPRCPEARQWYALWLTEMGRYLEAMQMIDAALAEEQASPNLLTYRCSLLYYERRFAEASAACRQALEVDPRYHFAHDFLLRVRLIEGDRAAAVYHAVRRFNPERLSAYGDFEAALNKPSPGGVRDVALTILEHGWFQDDFYVAMLQSFAGDRGAALSKLETVVRQHQFFSIFVPLDPLFDALRGDPRFQALGREMGLPANAN